MIISFKLFEDIENKKVIEDSYNDYMTGKLSDWIDKFKDEKIVLDELPKIRISPDDPYGEEQWE